jgi:nucleoid-associated protein YgaU
MDFESGMSRGNKEREMGLFDSIKSAFGKSEPGVDSTVSPSQVLREAGVDPTELNFGFRSDGTVTVSGSVSDEAERQKVLDTLSGISEIDHLEDQMTIAAAEPVEVAVQDSKQAEPEAIESEAPAPAAVTGRSYTVQSGDTLWKIADEMYGDGSKYMIIFDANSELLEHPDRIFPGQELTIPNPED